MIGEVTSIWDVLSPIAYGVGALSCAVMAAWLFQRRQKYGLAGTAIIGALAITAMWALVSGATGPTTPAAGIADSLRSLGWLFVAYRLFASDGRHESVRPIRPVVIALAFVEMLQPALHLMTIGADAERISLVYHFSVMFRLLVAVGALVLMHNLYVGASPQARIALRWPASALALLWAFDLNYFTIAYLSGGIPTALATLRGLLPVAAVALLGIGAGPGSEALRFRPSRTVAFQSVSLMLIGGYLVVMVGIAQWLSYAGGNFAQFMQLGFVAAASVAAFAVLPSARMRGWLRVMLAKHLFQHRYDYRAEWLRFTRTIGRGGEKAAPLRVRIVQAVADIADSPSGLLLIPGDHGELVLAAQWQWPIVDMPATAMSPAATQFFERGCFIVDLDDLRAGRDVAGESAIVPDWFREETRAWALVPLLHYDRLVGVVVLARPPQDRKLDWEDFDLLRVVGQQLASYLAEHAGQEALAEASRFDDFHRRIAFVMHDVKNLASQLSLLARNAEHHAENPEFRADMLVTLRNSADKLNTMLARLSRYGGNRVEALVSVDIADVARAVERQFAGHHPVVVTQAETCLVSAQREPLEQALLHIVQNAVDASAENAGVFLRVSADTLHGTIEVVDSGTGMSPEFLRARLFKPFDSSKQGGFGIGAYEARELIHAMRGRVDVESREGLGSRFTIRLPLAATAELLDSIERSDKRVA